MPSSGLRVLLTAQRLIGHRARPKSLNLVENSELIVRVLENKLKLVCVSNLSNPLAHGTHLTALWNAGSKHEDYNREERGVVHLLRRSFGTAAGEISAFGLTRTLQQMGASVESSSSREHTQYNLSLSSSQWLEDALKFWASGMTGRHFYPWEIKDVVFPLMHRDLDYLERRNAETLLRELIHAASFGHHSLAQSIFCPAANVDSISEEAAVNFSCRHFQPSKLTLVAVSSDLAVEELADRLEAHLSALEKRSGLHWTPLSANESEAESTTPPLFKSGGERRVVAPDLGLCWLALAVPGCSAGADWLLVELANRLALRRIRATSGDQLQQRVAGFNWAYQEGGLAGVELCGQRRAVIGCLPAVFAGLVQFGQTADVTDAELQECKRELIGELSYRFDDTCQLGLQLGRDLSLVGMDTSAKWTNFDSIINQISIEDVKKTIKSHYGSGSFSMSAVGDIHGVQYLADLSQ